MTDRRTLPRRRLLAIATLQGLLLLVLYRTSERGVWPSDSPAWSFPLWTLAIVLPLMLLLGLEHDRQRRFAAGVAGLGGVLAVLSAYTGFQGEPSAEIDHNVLVYPFALSIGVACFKALMYLQQSVSGRPLSYSRLFTYSWRNFLVLTLACMFMAAVLGVLRLWAALFEILGIDFFRQLFGEDWFRFPVLAFALGLGIVIFRELVTVIDGITRLLQGLIKLLLPLLLVVSLMFLGTLPFTGLERLWSTGWGTGLMLWLLALQLFFVNAVYQDGRHAAPYPPALHAFVSLGLLCMPAISAVALYGLWLRLDQHGWSVARGWAVLVWALLSLFAAGYVGGILWRRLAWNISLARVNTAAGVVVMTLLLLANSPLLDFRKMAVASQLSRVENGDLEIPQLDFWYLRYGLARPGHLALEDLEAGAAGDPELLAQIRNPTPPALPASRLSAELDWNRVHFRPEAFEVPPEVRERVETRWAFEGASERVLLRIDLDEDGEPEYVFIASRDGHVMPSVYFFRDDGVWREGSMVPADTILSPLAVGPGPAPEVIPRDVDRTLAEGEIALQRPRFGELRIGELTLVPR